MEGGFISLLLYATTAHKETWDEKNNNYSGPSPDALTPFNVLKMPALILV
jgi:hypothetical protein